MRCLVSLGLGVLAMGHVEYTFYSPQGVRLPPLRGYPQDWLPDLIRAKDLRDSLNIELRLMGRTLTREELRTVWGVARIEIIRWISRIGRIVDEILAFADTARNTGHQISRGFTIADAGVRLARWERTSSTAMGILLDYRDRLDEGDTNRYHMYPVELDLQNGMVAFGGLGAP